jgi:hypothetical protein
LGKITHIYFLKAYNLQKEGQQALAWYSR